MDLKRVQAELEDFAQERDWGRYHAPKNLAAALAVEAGELLEIFQWMQEIESERANLDDRTFAKVEEEVGDIGLYLLRFCDRMNIDLEAAMQKKLRTNAEKYPVEKARGTSAKYTDL